MNYQKFSWLAVLAFSLSALAQVAPPAKLSILILTGQRDTYHEWVATTAMMKSILEATGRFEVKMNEEPRDIGAGTLAHYDAILINYLDRGLPERGFGPRTEAALLEFVRSGKGLLLPHYTLGSFRYWEEFEQLAGGVYRPGFGGHGARQDVPVKLRDENHPITKGLKSPLPHYQDELYAHMRFRGAPGFHLLASAWDDHSLYKEAERKTLSGPGTETPVLWTVPYGKGRVVGYTLGHDAEIMRSRTYGVLLTRSLEWAASGEVTIAIPKELQKQ